MFGAVHLGLLAALIVLFVPLGMAGWHLSRNKVLFFSCALFITLAVGVHLTPYFPSISDFLSPPPPHVIISSPTTPFFSSCLLFLHSVVFKDVRVCRSNSGVNDDDDDCRKDKSWDWIQSNRVSKCQFQKLINSEASILLNGSWVVIAGDSQARLMAVSLLELVMGSEGVERIRADLFKRHTDYSVTVDQIGMKLDFVWAPYVVNLTQVVLSFNRNNNKTFPDLFLMGAGLWDMLHVNNVMEYGASLRMLRDSTLALLPKPNYGGGGKDSKSIRLLHLFWVGMPTLITSMLNTEEKRDKMSDIISTSYDDEVTESKLLTQSGGPLMKLDIRLLSNLCGPQCTTDGMHYDGIVYDAAVQVLLNALLIQSHQKPL